MDGVKDIDEEQHVEGESGVDTEADVVGAEGGILNLEWSAGLRLGSRCTRR